MSLREEKSTKRTKPSYLTAIISITLVLLNLGILGATLLLSKDLPKSLKENLEFQIELNKDIPSTDIQKYSDMLKNEEYTKSLEFVSEDKAAEILQKELGEDFKGLLGFNPLFSSFNIKINSDFLDENKLKEVETSILNSGFVKSVNYDVNLINVINNYTKRIVLPLVGFAVLLFIIALFLIDSTIRLSLYSKRFLVRSMKLVGATEWFIMKPFIKSGVFIGAVSGVIASLILIVIVFPGAQYYFDVSVLENSLSYITLIFFLITLGVLISALSTLKAVKKYLQLKLNDLY